MKIIELSKEELLCLIYHALPNTRYEDHPCFCASCGKGYEGEVVSMGFDEVKPLAFICDGCEGK